MLQFVLPTKRGPCSAVKSNFAIYHLVNVAVDFAPVPDILLVTHKANLLASGGGELNF